MTLTFGSFITPTASDPEAPVRLAVLSEEVGLDLVTVQDHPYQPGFLDTSTLLAFIGARTERVHLAANVANLPLRPPAVLARAAASLDLLTGGRFELGLGAGAFWEAIEAMGGPHRAPGEAVTALTEAIAVIRGIWAEEDRTLLRVTGTSYAVNGAKRGPAPAHDIGIWLGAYQPRMLDIVGRLADGWLPSMSYLGSVEALDEGHARIDAAAAKAGRAPESIRRILNISPREAGFDDLLRLVRDHRIDTLILGTDDPGELTRFGRQTAPRLREASAGQGAG
ncbi:MAG: LLM class flavin-dependent oxidoreductase [Nostocoides sp.]